MMLYISDMSTIVQASDDSIIQLHRQLEYIREISQPVFCSQQTVSREQLSIMIDTAFWASLRFNEGRTTRVCILVAAPGSLSTAAAFRTPVPYDESQIVKLAPAVKTGGCLLISAPIDGSLCIWGLWNSRNGPWEDSVLLELSEPGTVRVGLGVFKTFAVFHGRSIFMVEGSGLDLSIYLGQVLRRTFPADDFFEAQAVAREYSALVKLTEAIVEEGHGGTVLVVPRIGGEWQMSVAFAYQFDTPNTIVRDLIRSELDSQKRLGEVFQRLSASDLPPDLKALISNEIRQDKSDIRGAALYVASLAGVDGAIITTPDMSIVGFGAKITIAATSIPRVCMLRPEPGTQNLVLSPLEDIGGTRHQSAVRFVDANRDTVALVISQDRHLSVVSWDKASDSVAVVRNAEWWI
jgi:hypothetical protein